MGSSKSRAEVRFRCGHKRLFQFPYPERGDQLWCSDCSAEQTVVHAPDSFHLSCTRCSFGSGRSPVSDLDRAKESGRKHVKLKRSHKVRIENGDEPVYMIAEHDEGELFSGETFRTVAKDIQAIMKLPS